MSNDNSASNLEAESNEYGAHELHIAKSLDEALHLAKDLVPCNVGEMNGLQCWVAGGERLYTESLKHPSAQELHMSVVDLEIDVTDDHGNVQNVAYFPARYRWDNNFRQIHSQEYRETAIGDFYAPRFTYYIHERIRRKS